MSEYVKKQQNYICKKSEFKVCELYINKEITKKMKMETSAFTWSRESYKDHCFHTNNEEKANNLQNHKFS